MLLRLDGRGPRYGQITRALTGLIQIGDLRPGSRVPPTRELARDVGCSRNIVLLAYEQLTLEGYLVARSGAGTFVSPDLPDADSPNRRAADPGRTDFTDAGLSSHGRRLAAVATEARNITRGRRRFEIDFRYGLCEPDARAVARVRAAFAAALRQQTFGYGDPAGDPLLRQQVAERLRGVRGIVRTADQILVTCGAQQALDLCARLLITEGDRVVVEDPGYEGAQAAFRSAGAELVRIPVDANGLDPAALPEDGHPVRLVYVTPSHQFPTGAVMPAARRFALLAWARRRGVFIIEDDYNGEFRYAGSSIESLSALEPEGRVIYCGTLAKSLFPALRLGYLALPEALVPAAIAAKWLTDRGSSALLQRTVGELMAAGEYDRHIRRMLRRYRTRREALIKALYAQLGHDVEISGGSSGSHLAVWFPNLAPELVPDLVAGCKARGVGVYALAEHAALPLHRAGLMLGYGLMEVESISRGVKVLSEIYRSLTAENRRGVEPERASRRQTGGGKRDEAQAQANGNERRRVQRDEAE
jgi:GntR family transcriptional regulator / MocR family aminotransferase